MSLIFPSFFCEEEDKDQAIRGCMLTKDVVLRLAAEFAMTGGLKLKAGGQIGWWWLDTILKWTTSLLRGYWTKPLVLYWSIKATQTHTPNYSTTHWTVGPTWRLTTQRKLLLATWQGVGSLVLAISLCQGILVGGMRSPILLPNLKDYNTLLNTFG